MNGGGVIASACLVILIACLVNCCIERLCVTDADCRWNECCITKFTGEKKICKDMGDDVGDVCGGRYFCNTCSRNLVCIPVAFPQGLDGSNCSFPANGTCQPQFPLPVPNPALTCGPMPVPNPALTCGPMPVPNPALTCGLLPSVGEAVTLAPPTTPEPEESPNYVDRFDAAPDSIL